MTRLPNDLDLIVITGPLPGEMPGDYCPVCECALVMHIYGPCHVHDLNLTEVRMSDCRYGCKVFRCGSCGDESVLHSATYGCRGGVA